MSAAHRQQSGYATVWFQIKKSPATTIMRVTGLLDVDFTRDWKQSFARLDYQHPQ